MGQHQIAPGNKRNSWFYNKLFFCDVDETKVRNLGGGFSHFDEVHGASRTALNIAVTAEAAVEVAFSEIEWWKEVFDAYEEIWEDVYADNPGVVNAWKDYRVSE